MTPRLSIILMAFNEAPSLESAVQEVYTVLEKLRRAYEVIIIDDGSSDATGTIADQLAVRYPSVRVVHHKTNRGLGEVYRTGFVQARGDFLSFFPADGQFPATILEQFLPLMEQADMVLGYLPEGRRSLIARGLSAVEKGLYKLFFGPLPEFQGILMFKRRLLQDIKLRSTGRGWAVLMELIIRTSRGEYRIRSVPTQIRARWSGRSKVNNFSTIVSNLGQVMLLRRYL